MIIYILMYYELNNNRFVLKPNNAKGNRKQ